MVDLAWSDFADQDQHSTSKPRCDTTFLADVANQEAVVANVHLCRDGVIQVTVNGLRDWVIIITSPPQSHLGRVRRSRTTMQQSLHWLRHKFTSKLPFPFDDHHSHLIHPSSSDLTHYSKRHLDPVSRFAKVHFPDRHTDRQMGRRQVSKLALTLSIESDVLKS